MNFSCPPSETRTESKNNVFGGWVYSHGNSMNDSMENYTDFSWKYRWPKWDDRDGSYAVRKIFVWKEISRSKFVDKHMSLASVRIFCFSMVALSLQYIFHIVLFCHVLLLFAYENYEPSQYFDLKKTREISILFLKEQRRNPSISIGTYALRSLCFVAKKLNKEFAL